MKNLLLPLPQRKRERGNTSSLRVPYANDSNESLIVAASMLRRGVARRGECRVLLRGSVLAVSDVEETSGRGFPAGRAL
jgi:hypothetical protein